MMEVCFTNSVKGALALAQHCVGGAIGGALGGKREDIVGISFVLSEGDIKSPICFGDCPRKDYLRTLSSFDRYHEWENIEAAINEFWANCMKDLQKLKSNPPQIRVWLDHTPDAQCGVLFLAELLKDGKTEIHVVELPRKITRKDNCIVEYRGWGDVDPQLFGTFADNEKVLTEIEIRDFAGKWQLLKNENSLLRVVKNDSVVSADVSYYDELIKKEFPKGTCKIASMIGSVLGKQKVLTSDVFIAKRIQRFIENGELIVLDKTEKGFYSTIVGSSK